MATKGKNADTEMYTAADIQVLGAMEAVRRRPGMYIGSTDQRGLHHLIYEIVDNSVDEFMAGQCSRVDIRILEDGTVRTEDDGARHSGGHPSHHAHLSRRDRDDHTARGGQVRR